MALQDGRLLWRQPLPAAAPSWRVLRAGEHLLIYPQATEAAEFRLEWVFGIARLRVASRGEGAFLFLVGRHNGQLLQRLNLDIAPAHPSIQFSFGLHFPIIPRLRIQPSMVDLPRLMVGRTQHGFVVIEEKCAWGWVESTVAAQR
jgi:hypothetical protein